MKRTFLIALALSLAACSTTSGTTETDTSFFDEPAHDDEYGDFGHSGFPEHEWAYFEEYEESYDPIEAVAIDIIRSRYGLENPATETVYETTLVEEAECDLALEYEAECERVEGE